MQHFTNKLILFVFYINFIHTQTQLCIIFMSIDDPLRQFKWQLNLKLCKIQQTYPGAINPGVPWPDAHCRAKWVWVPCLQALASMKAHLCLSWSMLEPWGTKSPDISSTKFVFSWRIFGSFAQDNPSAGPPF